MDVDLLLSVLRAFAEHGLAYRVVGGVALNLQGIPRNTVDLDIFIEPTPDNVSKLCSALTAVFADPDIAQISADDLLGAYPALQYTPPQGDFRLDVLTRLGEAFCYDDIEAEELQVEDISVQVATPRMLYRMKKDTVRLQDRADAARLLQIMRSEEDG
jgi:hypothetical protein